MDMLDRAIRDEEESDEVNFEECFHCGAPVYNPRLGAEAALCDACDDRD
jgi:hypothetical protein